MTVTVDDVREALNEIDDKAIPDSTIEQKLQIAKLQVKDHGVEKNESKPTEDITAYENAVIQYAAYEAFTSSPPQTQRSAVDTSISWNTSQYIKELKRRKDEALELTGSTRGGTSADFMKTTDSNVID